MNTFQWYNENLVKLEDVRENYDPHDRAAAFQLLAETESLVTGIIYEEEGSLPFGSIVPSADINLVDYVKKPAEELFEELCREFR